ncbi:hypothetical protein [Enterobacter soli]|uniref:hypothetical protein n=1 Tax=Enterobacter soli TaxID=885040 RepID=UPI002F3F7824
MEFTKDQLIRRARFVIQRHTKSLASYPDQTGVAMDVELARIALASMETAPENSAAAPARKKGVSVSDLHDARQVAADTFKNDIYGPGGFVVVFDGKCAGWISALNEPQGWEPESIAVNEKGEVWLAYGGNAYDGAQSWEPLQDGSGEGSPFC